MLSAWIRGNSCNYFNDCERFWTLNLSWTYRWELDPGDGTDLLSVFPTNEVQYHLVCLSIWFFSTSYCERRYILPWRSTPPHQLKFPKQTLCFPALSDNHMSNYWCGRRFDMNAECLHCMFEAIFTSWVHTLLSQAGLLNNNLYRTCIMIPHAVLRQFFCMTY